MRNRFRSIRNTLVTAASLALPAFALQAAAVLDQKTIHNAYNEGDFDQVVQIVDAFNKAHKSYSRTDSIFIAKHLAVVYSANPKTREKGRYYMYRLLEMMPSAELVDMFVSDEIDRIFDKVRREFLTRQKGFGVDSSRMALPEKREPDPRASAQGAAAPETHAGASAPSGTGPSREYLSATDPGEGFWKRNAFWVAGGVGVAVAGTVALFILTQDEPEGETIVIGAAPMVRE